MSESLYWHQIWHQVRSVRVEVCGRKIIQLSGDSDTSLMIRSVSSSKKTLVFPLSVRLHWHMVMTSVLFLW